MFPMHTIASSLGQLSVLCRLGLRWWGSEIAAAVPTRVTDWLGRDHRAYTIRVDGPELVLSRDVATGCQIHEVALQTSNPLLAALSAQFRSGAFVKMLLPKSWVLKRSVTLPLAAASELQAATSFLIDRISPFQADDVLHSARVLTRDRKAKTLCAEVAIVPRDLFEPILSKLTDLHVPVSHIQIPGSAPGTEWNLPVVRKGGAHDRPLLDRSWKAMFVAALALTILGPQIVAFQVHEQAETLAEELAVAKVRTRRAASLREKVEAQSAELSFLATRQIGPRAIEIVDALSSMLPDDAWVFRLDVQPGEASLAGFSSDVPRLLKSLARPPFASPELTAPVLSGRADNKNRFELRVRVVEGAPG